LTDALPGGVPARDKTREALSLLCLAIGFGHTTISQGNEIRLAAALDSPDRPGHA
jgi:hypothetical protein